MASPVYRGKIEHNEKTIMQLYKTQYHTYDQIRMFTRLLIGIALVFVAAFVSLPVWARGIILLLGAWLIVSLDFPSQVRADKVIETRHGSLPKMHYEFFDDSMKLSGEGSMSIAYKKFSRLVQDSEYLYIFMSRDSVCMIDRSTVKPDSDEALMRFVSEKTGIEWKKEQALLSMNFYDIRRMFSERNKK